MKEQNSSEDELTPQVLLDAILELTESNQQVARSILMLASALREQAAAMLDEDEGFTTLNNR